MLADTTSIQKRILINTDLDIIVARLRVREIARDMGFGTIDQARISLAASELARVLTQTATQKGEILVSGVQTNGHLGIQVVSIAQQTMTNPADQIPITNVMALVDDGHIDTTNGQTTRVTLMKWLG